jgi:hypothetical protein
VWHEGTRQLPHTYNALPREPRVRLTTFRTLKKKIGDEILADMQAEIGVRKRRRKGGLAL